MSDTSHRVSWGTILAFGAPGLGAGYMYLFLSIYVMKYSTDVLLIAPVVMGLIFCVSRFWDAISEPLVGYLSDRTTSRLGRRRIWILASSVPIAGTFYMVFAAPIDLSQTELNWWMAVAIIGFYSAMTLFFVPHMALGAELTDNYHERSRLFGFRHIAFTLGSILCLAGLALLQASDPSDLRTLVKELALLAVIIMVCLLVFAVMNLRERSDFQGRVSSNPFQAYKDVWLNPHARLLIVVTFIEHVGSAAIAVLTLYVMQYVVGAPSLAIPVILAYMIPSTASVPFWIPLSVKYGKIRIWMASMIGTGVSFGGFFLIPFIDDLNARILLSFLLAIFAGISAGCGGTISPSVQSDVIDYDELVSGERKEGSYFAAWNFVYKGAAGVMLLLTGFVLELSGFVPNVEQTEVVKFAIVGLYGLFPLVCYLVGAYLFTKFRLDEPACIEIRRKLEVARSR